MFMETLPTHPISYSDTKIRISAKYCIRYGKFFYLCILNGSMYRAYKRQANR